MAVTGGSSRTLFSGKVIKNIWIDFLFYIYIKSPGWLQIAGKSTIHNNKRDNAGYFLYPVLD